MIGRLLIERSSHKFPQGATLQKRGRSRGRGATRQMANQLAQACPPPHRRGSSSRVLVGMTSSSVAVSESFACPPTRIVLIASCAWMSNGYVVTNISWFLCWTRGERGGRGHVTKPLDLRVRPSSRARSNAGCVPLVVIASSRIRRLKRATTLLAGIIGHNSSTRRSLRRRVQADGNGSSIVLQLTGPRPIRSW